MDKFEAVTTPEVDNGRVEQTRILLTHRGTNDETVMGTVRRVFSGDKPMGIICSGESYEIGRVDVDEKSYPELRFWKDGDAFHFSFGENGNAGFTIAVAYILAVEGLESGTKYPAPRKEDADAELGTKAIGAITDETGLAVGKT